MRKRTFHGGNESRDEFTRLPHPSLEELVDGLRRWSDQVPSRLQTETAGTSREGRPVILATITDQSVPGNQKQNVVFTASDTGRELNACTGLLHFIKWLISEDPVATRFRRAYTVVVLPCIDPDGYETEPPSISSPAPYTAWTWNGPETGVPEAQAVFDVLERYTPEAHVGVHGIGVTEGHMWESTGISWASTLSRPSYPAVVDYMDESVEKEGYLITRGERDAGHLRATHDVVGAREHFYYDGRSINAMLFSYHRYHSLAFTMEAGFDDSILLRARALLEAGLDDWRWQRDAGFPVDHVNQWLGTQLAAWGTEPGQRRRSRVELWQNVGQYAVGATYPEHRGTVGSVAAFSEEGFRQLGNPAPDERWKTAGIDPVFERLTDEEQFDIDGLHAWCQERPTVPEGFEWPQAGIAMRGPAEFSVEVTPPDHGVLINMLIPYRHATIVEVSLDGRPIEESATDGYTLTRDPGCVVHVAIPPGEVQNLHIATCTYQPEVERRAGFTTEDWTR